MQKQYCKKPKPQYESKQCQRIDGSLTSETNNWQIKSCNLKACNRPPVLVVDDLNPKMTTNDPIKIVAEAYDPDNKPLIFRKHEDLIEIKASETMGTYKRTY
jgi:hypothetical protein